MTTSMKLIRAKNIDAYFIIQPFNPFYYINLNALSPTIDEVRTEIKGNKNLKGYDCADFFITDTAKYDRGLLTDIMHFSNYGWYKTDQYIIDHYNLKQ